MQMTEDGLALIREFEGFRGRAYRDAVGIWTIGFGHTAMAGAPEVSQGMEISQAEAEKILAHDVDGFARGVARLVSAPLNNNEFSALVSFAYNVGLGNFAASSVLKAVNAGEPEAVPRRLQLWVKAGGRVLPGLVKRRAAEAALFLKSPEAEAKAPVEVPSGKPAHKSTTIWAALALTLLAGLDRLALVTGYGVLGLVALAGICAAAFWIIRERRKKAKEEGIWHVSTDQPGGHRGEPREGAALRHRRPLCERPRPAPETEGRAGAGASGAPLQNGRTAEGRDPRRDQLRTLAHPQLAPPADAGPDGLFDSGRPGDSDD